MAGGHETGRADWPRIGGMLILKKLNILFGIVFALAVSISGVALAEEAE
jgi:hypothetical protein